MIREVIRVSAARAGTRNGVVMVTVHDGRGAVRAQERLRTISR